MSSASTLTVETILQHLSLSYNNRTQIISVDISIEGISNESNYNKEEPIVYNSVDPLDDWKELPNLTSLDCTGHQYSSLHLFTCISTLTSLNLSCNHLSGIEIYNINTVFPHLQTLDLSHNHLGSSSHHSDHNTPMVSNISYLCPSLTSLNLCNNYLTNHHFLSTSFHTFTRLKHLNLSSNQLICHYHTESPTQTDELWYSFLTFPSLTSLDLSYNSITSLPSNLYRYTSTPYTSILYTLHTLLLVSNNITEIHHVVYGIQSFRRLHAVDLSDNPCTSIRKRVDKNDTDQRGSDIRMLEELLVNGCGFKVIVNDRLNHVLIPSSSVYGERHQRQHQQKQHQLLQQQQQQQPHHIHDSEEKQDDGDTGDQHQNTESSFFLTQNMDQRYTHQHDDDEQTGNAPHDDDGDDNHKPYDNNDSMNSLTLIEPHYQADHSLPISIDHPNDAIHALKYLLSRDSDSDSDTHTTHHHSFMKPHHHYQRPTKSYGYNVNVVSNNSNGLKGRKMKNDGRTIELTRDYRTNTSANNNDTPNNTTKEKHIFGERKSRVAALYATVNRVMEAHERTSQHPFSSSNGADGQVIKSLHTSLFNSRRMTGSHSSMKGTLKKATGHGADFVERSKLIVQQLQNRELEKERADLQLHTLIHPQDIDQ